MHAGPWCLLQLLAAHPCGCPPPCRFLVYELPPGSSGAAAAGRPHPPQLVAQTEVPDSAASVHSMGWVGSQLAVCCGTRYILVAPFGPPRGAGSGGQWRELFSVPPELAYWPAMLAAMPDVAQALLVVVSGCAGPGSLQMRQPRWQGTAGISAESDVTAAFKLYSSRLLQPAAACGAPELTLPCRHTTCLRPPPSATVQGPAGIIVDAGGSPVGSALRLEGLGATPRALAASGPFLLLVSEAGIHVYDRRSGGEVQRLAFSQDLRPLPGQPLYAAAAGDGAPPPAAAAAAAGPGTAGCVAVAGRRIVWLCLPVSPVDQARELLGRRDFEPALELIEAGLAQGAPWAQAGAAQAALLLLQGTQGRGVLP